MKKGNKIARMLFEGNPMQDIYERKEEYITNNVFTKKDWEDFMLFVGFEKDEKMKIALVPNEIAEELFFQLHNFKNAGEYKPKYKNEVGKWQDIRVLVYDEVGE